MKVINYLLTHSLPQYHNPASPFIAVGKTTIYNDIIEIWFELMIMDRLVITLCLILNEDVMLKYW